ncbi:MAG: WG repeat-containing protein [Bacteroidetes bacterium]|nr:WG repeat-containing protein [Bacteroidota bacterium]
MKKSLIITLIVAGVAIAGFAIWKFLPGNSEITMRYVPIKEEGEERWSILDLETGEIVVDREWKNQPSLVFDGITAVENADDNYEFFTVEKKPVKIGKAYKSAGFFIEGLAPVAEPDQPVSYIDKSGKEVFRLKEADGKVVEEAGHFRGGLARFRNSERKWGYIDRNGKVAIKAKFSSAGDFREGYAVVEEIEKKGTPGDSSYKEISKVGIIGTDGKYVLEPKEKTRLLPSVSNGLIAYWEESGENEKKKGMWGFMDPKGERVIKARKELTSVLPFIQDYASFSDGESWGIMDKKGEIALRAKYDNAIYYNGMVMVEEDKKWGFVDMEGKELIAPEYKELYPFFNKHALARDNDNFILIDKKGKEVSKKSFKVSRNLDDFFEAWITGVYPTVKSDYVDASSTISSILKSAGMEKLNALSGKSLPQMMQIMEVSDDDLYSYGSSFTKYRYEMDNMSLSIECNFDDQVKKAITTTEYIYGYPYESVSGYGINNNAKLSSVSLNINLYGKLQSKTKKLVDELESRLTAGGYQLNSNYSSDDVKVFGEYGAIIRFSDDKIELHIAYIGSLSPMGSLGSDAEYEGDEAIAAPEVEAQAAPVH